MNNHEPWYGAKCVFLHRDLSRRKARVYEERVVLIRARSFKEALRKGEAEAKRYERSLKGIEYLGFIAVYHMFDSKVGDGSEIYSLMRTISLSKRGFLRRYHGGGRAHERNASELRR